MSSSNGVCAVVPFKSLQHAKQRLADYLNTEQRAKLVAAMLEDTLRALIATEGLNRVLLVSNDPFTEELATRLGVDQQSEPAQSSGLNAVLQAVCTDLAQQGYESVLIAHGDLPLLVARELRQLLGHHRALASSAKISLVPDRARDGSNCLLCSPPNVLRFSYGQGSCEKHLAIAAQGGIQSEVVELAGASLDIDEPLDLQHLVESTQLHSASKTHQVITQATFQR
ncbi:MAG: 2-phospho-L-lactate guanylyltransferase [Pseudomonadales bacterium]